MASVAAPLLRPDLYLIVRFLERLQTKGGPLVKTRLQVAIGVNYTVFARYLQWMLERGLVERLDEGGKELFRISRKGYDTYLVLVSLATDAARPEPGKAGPPRTNEE